MDEGHGHSFSNALTVAAGEWFPLMSRNRLTGLAVKRRSRKEDTMPRGDKSKYTSKQKRKAGHIAESYEKRGVSEQEAERWAWATVNKDDGGGEKEGGSGRGKSTGHPAAHRGGAIGGKAAAKKAAAARKRHAEHHAH
jgi:plasmid stabilization system protein ParE